MGDAWVEYDKTDGRIVSISWNEIENSIRIEQAFAEDLMNGKENILSWKVSVGSNGPALTRISINTPKLGLFWSLVNVKESGVDISLDSNILTITVDNPTDKMLYATMKDDPSWLINSWMLEDLSWIDNKASIPMQKSDCSFYIGLKK